MTKDIGHDLDYQGVVQALLGRFWFQPVPSLENLALVGQPTGHGRTWPLRLRGLKGQFRARSPEHHAGRLRFLPVAWAMEKRVHGPPENHLTEHGSGDSGDPARSGCVTVRWGHAR